MITAKPRPAKPCMLEEKPKQGYQQCKRMPSPTSSVSSPVSSEVSIKKVHSEELTARQVQDCKVHRVMTEGEVPRRRGAGRMNPDGSTPAWEMNKCLWRNKTCSEEFVDKMLSEKRKRDRKAQHCKY